MDTKVIAIAIAAIFIVGAVGVVFMNSGNDGGDEEQPTSEYCLKIFGNANGDYSIDDKDKEIIQSVIDNKTKKADLMHVKDVDGKVYCLADGNLDGVVDSKDLDIVDGIKNRTVSSMNIIDSFGYKLSVPMNIERIACDYFATAEVLQLMGVQDKIVAVSHALVVLKDQYLMGAKDVYDFGGRTKPTEGVNDADPQVWVVSENYHSQLDNASTATVIGFDTLTFDSDNVLYSKPVQSVMMAGYIFNNVAKATEYKDWYVQTWNFFNDKTKNIADADRPVVAYTGYGGYIHNQGVTEKQLRYFPSNTVLYQAVELAGGVNLFDKYPDPGALQTSPRPTANVYGDFEWWCDQKYDFLFAHCTKYTGKGDVVDWVPDHGYLLHDYETWEETEANFKKAQQDVANLEIFKNSVPSENVYLTPGDYMNGASGGLLSTALVATAIHPELFPEGTVQDLHQQYLDLMGFDYDLTTGGVFFVPNDAA